MPGMAGKVVGVSGNPDQQATATGCTDARCASVIAITTDGAKQITLTVTVGDRILEVVTTKSFGGHVAKGKLVAVGMPGSICCEKPISRPTLLSAHHLGWAGGGDGAAVMLSDKTCVIGDAAPLEKPKRSEVKLDALGNVVVEEGVESLYATKKKKPTKEEKAAAKRAKAEKIRQAKIASGELEPDEEAELVKASKSQLKKIKALVKAKRDDGEECLTDDELEAAGFLAQ